MLCLVLNNEFGFHNGFWSHKMSVMKWFTRLFCFLCLAWFCLGAQARISFKTGYFIDTSNHQTIETIRNQAFTGYQNELRLGYTDHPIWIQIQLYPVFDNLSFQANPIKLRIGPYLIDRIEKFEEVNHSWESEVRGATVKQGNESCFEDAHCFKLLSNPSLPNVIFIKLQTHGVIFLNIDLMDSEHLAYLNISKVKSTSFSIALAVIFLIFAIIIMMVRPSYLVFSYICIQVIVVFNLLYVTGAVSAYVSFMTPAQIKELSYYSNCSRALLIAQLIFSFLRPYHINKAYLALFKMVLLLTIFDFLLIAWGQINLALQVQLGIHLFNIFIQIYGFYTCNFKSKSIKNVLVISTVGYLFMFTYGLSNVMGWTDLKTPFVLQYYSNLNGAFIGLLVLMVGLYEARLQQLAKEAEIENLKSISFEAKLNSEKYKERSSLIDLLTHELMNPLGAIKFALASLKREGYENTNPVARLNRIESSVERMKNLIEQVSLSNRLESHQESYPLERVHARSVIEELIGDYADESRFHLKVDPEAYFYTNPILLNHILKNLIDNAYKYDSREGPIHVTVSRSLKDVTQVFELLGRPLLIQSDLTYFEISNAYGYNQKPDEMRIFDRYYRQENVMTKPGMGIGLSIVKTSLEKLNGCIHFSLSEQRAIFKLVL